MSMAGSSRVTEETPDAVWELLGTDKTAALVDVRTKAEWSFVGLPDLTAIGRSTLCVEWQDFPQAQPNPGFVHEVENGLGAAKTQTVFFICRSGARSMKAAIAYADACAGKGLAVNCVNVAEGFEGDLDTQKHRGGLNGWKARGLPWRQS